MGLTPPSFPIFFIATLAGGAGLAIRLGYLPMLAPFAFVLVALAFVLLWIACVFRNL
ncbi:hypothetical protein [Lysobacter changpingensis]|jgi:hypothetical protein|uniref:hypothetical protein n=1 Tax=Lysobacter changpingensis TaxID=2792784 RepID=UPI001A8E808E|nr:hypothetical protein [Lysobacter changpingensis]